MARTALAAASIALLSLFALAPTAQAATSATIVIQTAPPPVHYEATPRARRGMVWVPGHWEWRHDRYRWIDGHWIKARPGYRYNTPQWSERGGRWHMACSGRAPGEWSACEWVHTMKRMSPPAARQSLSWCSGSWGPGSTTK